MHVAKLCAMHKTVRAGRSLRALARDLNVW